jgi:hypothetical protein
MTAIPPAPFPAEPPNYSSQVPIPANPVWIQPKEPRATTAMVLGSSRLRAGCCISAGPVRPVRDGDRAEVAERDQGAATPRRSQRSDDGIHPWHHRNTSPRPVDPLPRVHDLARGRASGGVRGVTRWRACGRLRLCPRHTCTCTSPARCATDLARPSPLRCADLSGHAW